MTNDHQITTNSAKPTDKKNLNPVENRGSV